MSKSLYNLGRSADWNAEGTCGKTKRDQDEQNLNLLLKAFGGQFDDMFLSQEPILRMMTIIVKYAHENDYEYADMIEDTMEGLETFLINKEDQEND